MFKPKTSLKYPQNIGPEKSPIAIVKLNIAEATSLADSSSKSGSISFILLFRDTNSGRKMGAIPLQSVQGLPLLKILFEEMDSMDKPLVLLEQPYQAQ